MPVPSRRSNRRRRRGRARVSAPSSRISANANGWSSGCCTVGLATHVHDHRAGRADVDEVVRDSSAVSGSHSSGGHDHPVADRVGEELAVTQCGEERPHLRARGAGVWVLQDVWGLSELRHRRRSDHTGTRGCHSGGAASPRSTDDRGTPPATSRPAPAPTTRHQRTLGSSPSTSSVHASRPSPPGSAEIPGPPRSPSAALAGSSSATRPGGRGAEIGVGAARRRTAPVSTSGSPTDSERARVDEADPRLEQDHEAVRGQRRPGRAPSGDERHVGHHPTRADDDHTARDRGGDVTRRPGPERRGRRRARRAP